MAWLWLAGAISLEVVATLNLKMSEGFTKFWPSVVVVVGYVGSFALLGATLKRLDVGTVYAIWSGAGTVVVVFVGIWIFGESAAGVRLLGIGVITVGVIVVNLSGGGHGGESPEAKPADDEHRSDAHAAAAARPVAPPARRPGKHVALPRVAGTAAAPIPAQRNTPAVPGERGIAALPRQRTAPSHPDTPHPDTPAVPGERGIAAAPALRGVDGGAGRRVGVPSIPRQRSRSSAPGEWRPPNRPAPESPPTQPNPVVQAAMRTRVPTPTDPQA